MATRSGITIKYAGFDLYLYHHWDGYPENMIKQMEEMLMAHKPLGERDILHYLMKQFSEPDDLQPQSIEARGNMGEEFLYTISFPQGYMGHKTDPKEILITCEGVEGELKKDIDGIVSNTFMIKKE